MYGIKIAETHKNNDNIILYLNVFVPDGKSKLIEVKTNKLTRKTTRRTVKRRLVRTSQLNKDKERINYFAFVHNDELYKFKCDRIKIKP